MSHIGDLNNTINLIQNTYQLQALDLLSICKKFETPFHLYDLDNIIKRYHDLHSYFKWPRVKIHYAMKANYNADILRALLKEGARLDTVSPAEVIYAMKLGYAKENILYTSNNMTNEEIRLLKNYDVLFNIDSLSGLKRYAEAFPGTEVCLRFNSEVEAGEHAKVQTGGDKTKFGVRFEDVHLALDIIKAHNLKVVGLHEHTGSGIADPELACQGMRNLLTVAKREWFPDLRFADFGGGFKVPYRPDEKRIDYDRFGAIVTDMFSFFCAEYGRELDLYFEPGKFMVAESGTLITRVNSLIKNRSRLIAGTDSGFSQFIRPVLYDAYHHILNVSNPGGEQKMYDVAGNICETGDLFASDRNLPEIREGDYLAVLNTGAYGFSMGSIYNLRPYPAEVVVEKSVARLSRPRVSHEAFADQILAAFV